VLNTTCFCLLNALADEEATSHYPMSKVSSSSPVPARRGMPSREGSTVPIIVRVVVGLNSPLNYIWRQYMTQKGQFGTPTCS
jgi:hypothetical protein